MTPEQAVRWSGVAIGFLAALLVSPSGAQRLARDLSAPLQAAWVAVLLRLGRRRVIAAEAHLTASSTLTVGGGGQVQVVGEAWSDEEPVERKVDRLRSQIEQVRQQVRALGAEVQGEQKALRRDLEQLQSVLSEELRTLRDLLQEQADEAQRIDARALPVIGLGVVLSGLSIDVGQSWLLASPLLALGWMVALLVLYLHLRDGRRTRSR